MFAEMREFARRHPKTGPATVLRMATVNGAKALGRAGVLGELSPGAEADLIAIPYHGSVRNATSTAVNYGGHVVASMIQGKWALTPVQS